jgi:hypothetical protein
VHPLYQVAIVPIDIIQSRDILQDFYLCLLRRDTQRQKKYISMQFPKLILQLHILAITQHVGAPSFPWGNAQSTQKWNDLNRDLI